MTLHVPTTASSTPIVMITMAIASIVRPIFSAMYCSHSSTRSSRGSAGSVGFAHDAAEAEMVRGGVDRLGHARGWPVAVAVVRCAQVRAALHDLARNADVTRALIDAAVARCAAR